MPKTEEELNALKEEAETVNGKLRELTPEELKQVAGGSMICNSVLQKLSTEICRRRRSPIIEAKNHAGNHFGVRKVR